MKIEEIESLFNQTLEIRGISEKLDGISKDVIYKWRKEKTKVSIGQMLNVLYQLDLILIQKK